MSELERAAEVMRAADTLALACHVHPDGDALGSMLALHLLCQAHDVPSIASWGQPYHVAPHYRFLPGLDTCTKPEDFPPRPEVMVTFDSGSLARLGSLAVPARESRQLVVLDHHADNHRFGTVNAVLPELASTSVVVRELARLLGWSLTREAALCIYVGLVTDTGRFQYQNTTPEVFELARELLEYDLPVPEINRELFERHRYQYLQLMADVTRRADLDRELGLVVAGVTAGDLARYDVEFDETEGLIDVMRSCAEASVACIAKEAAEGVRVSLRSTSELDVGAVARRLGGGGHRFSAGFVSDRPLPETLHRVRAEIAVDLGLDGEVEEHAAADR